MRIDPPHWSPYVAPRFGNPAATHKVPAHQQFAGSENFERSPFPATRVLRRRKQGYPVAGTAQGQCERQVCISYLTLGLQVAQLTAADYDKRTALHVAASAGHLEIVKYLIKYGCSVHARDRWDETPLLSAVHGNHWEVIKLLRQTGALMTLSPVSLGMELCLAASKNDTEQLESWRLAGAHFNSSDYDGRTPLHVASGHGHVEAVKYLVENGASAELTDAFGCAAIDDAKRHQQSDVIEYLENSK